MSTDPFSRLIVIADGEFASDIRYTTKERASFSDLVFGSFSGATHESCLYTWTYGDLVLPCYPTSVFTPVSPSTIEAMALMALPVPSPTTVSNGSATDNADTSVSQTTTTDSDGTAAEVPVDTPLLDTVEVGNVNTFQDPSYSPKDRAKLEALLHLRGFFVSSHTPPGKLGH